MRAEAERTVPARVGESALDFRDLDPSGTMFLVLGTREVIRCLSSVMPSVPLARRRHVDHGRIRSQACQA